MERGTQVYLEGSICGSSFSLSWITWTIICSGVIIVSYRDVFKRFDGH